MQRALSPASWITPLNLLASTNPTKTRLIAHPHHRPAYVDTSPGPGCSFQVYCLVPDLLQFTAQALKATRTEKEKKINFLGHNSPA